MPHLSVVIPVYKAENCLDELYFRLKTALEKISNDFEILLIEDHSDDLSWAKIELLAKGDTRVKGIKFSRNFGQHYGITAGLDFCDGDWVVIMDCDLQDRPEEINALYSKAIEGFDIVLAKKTKRNDGFFKRKMSSFFYQVFRFLSGYNYDPNIGNFRIISRKVVNSFRHMREQARFFGGLMNWLGFETATINVQHDPRFDGKTTYTTKKLLLLAFETIIAYSNKPLYLAIGIGFIFSFFSILYGFYIVYKNMVDGILIQGWSSLIVSIFFVGGIIITILGILGIYLGKVFDESRHRPLYVISKTTFNYEQ
jgi:polyisoprenyl-phosphate glycosyltransferase